MSDENLVLAFHGRVIEHIGDQMYQSPTAALAEMVSNAWDADANDVKISWDFSSDEPSDWHIKVIDDGAGMTKAECQERFLSVGYDRRKNNPKAKSSDKSRPLMGRKGIGKFAGFGIAEIIEVDTVSKATGEQTTFTLDYNQIRKGDSYIEKDALQVPTVHLAQADRSNGTIVTLRKLSVGRRISQDRFVASLARRFLINSTADSFTISVNSIPVPEDVEATGVEMSFPRDLPERDKISRNVIIDEKGWGTESLPSGRTVSWRVQFFESLIEDDEVRGITVFAHKKLAQRPFFFNIVGGTASNAGPEYLSGKVVADWVDELAKDVISTERQRLNWELPPLQELQDWGQALIRRLMSLWKQKRTDAKMATLSETMGVFTSRLDALGAEGEVVKKALEKLAGIEKLSKLQFQEIGSAVLLAWEQGRLRSLIYKLSRTEDLDEGQLVSILAEANAITALHTAEMVRSRIEAINGLEARVEARQLENAVRDFIAKNPWLISPQWETFAVERRLTSICDSAFLEAFKGHPDFDRRTDLVLSSGRQLLILEFMRPGKNIDFDHLSRFEFYTNVISEYVTTNSALGIDLVSGYLVADGIERSKPGNKLQIQKLKDRGLLATDWTSLIAMAKSQWSEFLDHVRARAPNDPRMTILADTSAPKDPVLVIERS